MHKIRLLLLPFLAHTLGAADLPDWYKSNRIQWHWENHAANAAEVGTERWQAWFKGVHAVIAASGAKVSVGAGRYGAEGAWWPTAVGEQYGPFAGLDILKESLIDDFRAHGLETIVYYRHDIDYAMQDQHPDWWCRDAEGNPVVKNRAEKIYGKTPYQMCQNSPFRDFTQKRLVEIFERGAGGVYFDEDHMPEVCYCDNCKKAFTEETGRPFPENPIRGKADYLELTRFVGKTLAETFSKWKAAVHQVNPDGVLLVSSSRYGEFKDLHHTEEMARVGSANKTEFQKCFGGQQHFAGADIRRLKAEHPDYWLPPRDLSEALEWMINRDVLSSAPPHVWVFKPDENDPAEALHTAAAVVAHGAVAGMGLTPRRETINRYREIFALNQVLAPFMKDARPYTWALIHVSNELKENLYAEGGRNLRENYKHRFENLIAPVAGAANTLRKAHVPFATISDTLLLKGEFNPEAKVLLVPSYDKLSEPLKKAAEASGLKVVPLSGDWHLESMQMELGKVLLSQSGTSPVFVQAPRNVFATFMVNEISGELLVSLVRDWHWFWFFGNNRQAGQTRSEEAEKQPKIENVKVNAPGRPFVLFPFGESMDDPVDVCRFIYMSNIQ